MKPKAYEDVVEALWKHSDLFWEKVEIAEPEACWLWRLKPTIYGYGQIRFDGLAFRAHRVAWLLTHGDIPEPLILDHLCAIRNCVNPNHLDTVTSQINSHRSLNSPASINSRKTHCVKGHELSGENLFISKLGRRICKECRRLANTSPEYRAKKKVRNRLYQARLTAKRRAAKCLTS